MKIFLIVPLFFGFTAAFILFSSLSFGALSAGFLFGVVQWSCKTIYNAALEIDQ